MQNKVFKIIKYIAVFPAVFALLFSMNFQKAEAGGCQGGCACPAGRDCRSPKQCIDECNGHAWYDEAANQTCPLCGSQYREGSPGGTHSNVQHCSRCTGERRVSWPCGGSAGSFEAPAPPDYTLTLKVNNNSYTAATITGKTSYTIQGGNPVPASVSVPSGIPAGWHFDGYYNKSDGGQKESRVNANGTTSQFPLTENLTWYAHYARNKYVVVYNGNYPEGKVVDNNRSLTQEFYYGQTTNTVDYAYGSSSQITVTCKLYGDPGYGVHGYLFDGWYTAPTGGSKITTWAELQGTLDSTVINSNGARINVYAHWTECKGNLYLLDEDSKYILEDITTTGTKSPYLIVDYLDSVTLPVLPQKKITVTFDANGGTVSTTSLVAKKTFDYWNTVDPFTASYNLNKRLFKNTYPVNGSEQTVKAYYTTEIITLPSPTRDGLYAFDGWYTSDDEFVGKGGTDYIPTSNITLKAKWSAINFSLQSEVVGATDSDFAKANGFVNLNWEFATATASQPATFKLYQSLYSDMVNKAQISSNGDNITVTAGYNQTYTSATTWTAPYTGFYTIDVAGAKGGNFGSRPGGNGGKVTITVYLEKGQKLNLQPNGISGGTSNNSSYGTTGGAGSYIQVYNGSTWLDLVYAGGGGGANKFNDGSNGGTQGSSIGTSTQKTGKTGTSGGGGGAIGGVGGQAVQHYHTGPGSSYIVSGTDLQPGALYSRSGGCFTKVQSSYCGGYLYCIGASNIRDNYEDSCKCDDSWHLHSTSCTNTIRCFGCGQTWQEGFTWYNHIGWGFGDGGDPSDGCIGGTDAEHLPGPAFAGIGKSAFATYCVGGVLPHNWYGWRYTPYRLSSYGFSNGVHTANVTRYACGCAYSSYANGAIISSSAAGGGTSFITSNKGIGNFKITGQSYYVGNNSGSGYVRITAKAEDLGIFSDRRINNAAATDITAPDAPVEIYFDVYGDKTYSYKWERPVDNGTVYYFQADAYKISTYNPNGSNTVWGSSNITTNTITTGLGGYYVLTDTSPSTVITSANKASAEVFTNLAITRYDHAWTPAEQSTQYIHVAYFDNAGNISGTITHEVPKESATPPVPPHCAVLGIPSLLVSNEDEPFIYHNTAKDIWYVNTENPGNGIKFSEIARCEVYNDETGLINTLQLVVNSNEGPAVYLNTSAYNYDNAIFGADERLSATLQDYLDLTNKEAIVWVNTYRPASETPITVVPYEDTTCLECGTVTSTTGDGIRVAADVTAPTIENNGTVSTTYEAVWDSMRFELLNVNAANPVNLKLIDNGSGIASAILYEVQDGPVKQEATAEQLAAAQASGYIDFNIEDNPQGRNRYYMVVTDNVGNTTEVPIMVVVDNIAPLVDPVGPLDPDENTTYTGVNTIIYDWTNNLILKYKVWDNETAVKTAILYDENGQIVASNGAITPELDENGNELYTGEDRRYVSWEDENHEYEGIHTFTLVVTDVADNVTTLTLTTRADYTDVAITGLELIKEAAEEMSDGTMTFDTDEWEDFDITVEADDRVEGIITSGIEDYTIVIRNSDSGAQETWSTNEDVATDAAHVLAITIENGDIGIYAHNEKSVFMIDAFMETCENTDLFSGHWTIDAYARDFAGNEIGDRGLVEEVSLTASLAPYYGDDALLGERDGFGVFKLGETLEVEIKTKGYIDAIYIELTPKNVLYNTTDFAYGARLYKGYTRGDTLDVNNGFEVVPISEANDRLLYCINPKEISTKGEYNTTIQIMLPLYLRDATIAKCDINIYAIRVEGDLDTLTGAAIVDGISEHGYDEADYTDTNITAIKKGTSFYVASEYDGERTSILDDFKTLLK